MTKPETGLDYCEFFVLKSELGRCHELPLRPESVCVPLDAFYELVDAGDSPLTGRLSVGGEGLLHFGDGHRRGHNRRAQLIHEGYQLLGTH